jgi:hypothetical protein
MGIEAMVMGRQGELMVTWSEMQFTDRLFGLRKRAATGEHEFDKLCADLDIEHRLTPPKRGGRGNFYPLLRWIA